jgi:chromatin remodeling complex protein RSC6
VKKNKLQDQVNKRMVNCDEKMKAVFGKTPVSMFEMAGSGRKAHERETVRGRGAESPPPIKTKPAKREEDHRGRSQVGHCSGAEEAVDKG